MMSIRALVKTFGAGWALRGGWPDHLADEAPLRAELFSSEQLQRHARELAGWHEVDARPEAYALLRRLGSNAEVLTRAHELVREGVASRQRIAPAAEWLLDNYYLIEEQILTSRRHLPPGYSRRLARLAKGPHRGLPRVYAIATEYIAHTDGRVDVEGLTRFVGAYQAVVPLTLGELWAIPIMLRLALIENLRRVAVRISDSHRACDASSRWFTRMLAERSPTDLVMVVADMVGENPTLTPAFVAEFARRLQEQNPSLAFATVWIEQRLAENHQTIAQMVLAEHQGQAADQVSISNAITSLRALSASDWRDFVETMSLVEAALRRDPAGIYPDMDFPTRDRYRHAVEELACRSRRSEEWVACEAVAMAIGPHPDLIGREPRTHVGFFLVAGGQIAFSRRVGARPSLGMRLAAAGGWLRLALYLGPVAVLTGGVVAAMIGLILVGGWRAADPWLPLWLALFGLLLAVASSQAAIACFNWLAMRLVRPELLPRLDYSQGIPPDRASLVVVPAMLRSARDVDPLVEGLEIRFLGNPGANLHFALLTDFADAPCEHLAEDEELLQLACAAIDALNHRYRTRRPGIFHLFHRARCWNGRDGIWMGRERKRGKLADLNRLLRHGEHQPFHRIAGDLALLTGVVYIITLDTDTQLPREEACKLIGTMAHPLNQAEYDAGAQRVVAGYGVLQPRVATSLMSVSRSRFAQLFAGEAGIDPYTRAVSDIYQDLFAEGSFIGKGIYDLDAFESATGRNLPDNAILSHDLIEGCYARCALVSDALVIEDHPSRYLADAARRHRWMRGDWQVAWWLLPWVPTQVTAPVGRLGPPVSNRPEECACAARSHPACEVSWVPARSGPGWHWAANPLPFLGRWKIFDNLRRSLVGPALLALLAAGWTLSPGPAWWWTALVLGLLLAPVALVAVASLCQPPAEAPFGMHLRAWSDDTGRSLARAGTILILLPYEALLAVDAAGRSLWRMLFSHRRLLAWQTAQEAEAVARDDLVGIVMAMWSAPLLALGLLALALRLDPGSLAAVLPLVLAWCLSPLLVWWLSRPQAEPPPRLVAGDRDYLGRLARRTWRFFETFVTSGDHWLPPDNYQEYELAAPAHRSSPTNIGLALLGNLAARDFGYLTVGQLLSRCEQTTASLLAMERHRGHFFNWYDTRSLQPLLPRYVSTVDSGNLTGHLLVLRAGIAELGQAGILPGRQLAGLRHTYLCLAAVVEQEPGGAVGADEQIRLAGITSRLRHLDEEIAVRPATLSAAFSQLGRLLASAEVLVQLVATEEQRWWSAALVRECLSQRTELTVLAPWCAMASAPLPAGGTGQRERLDNLRLRLLHLDNGTCLAEVAGLGPGLLPGIDRIIAGLGAEGEPGAGGMLTWLAELRGRIAAAAEGAAALLDRGAVLARCCTGLADADLGFLYDRHRKLFAIGFNVTDNRIDRSYYDLLASEALLGSFVAIAQGRVAQEHWFALGRQLTVSGGSTVLLSWSGSMFEYLMPQLVMPVFPGSLLAVTGRAVVTRQIEYGRSRSVPWGISESGYNRTDAQLAYQYRAFGVPGLGFKRGLADDLVIAPYASVLALMVDPAAACANLRRLSAEGHEGAFGLYEAIDYTPGRLSGGATAQTVQSYMAHHQGMSLLALTHLLLDQPMQRRFTADPEFKAALLLLQERSQRSAVVVLPHAAEAGTATRGGGDHEAAMRVFTDPDGPLPEVHLLSNGRYHVMIGTAWGGYSRWRDLAVNRWREDPSREAFGMFCYLRDVESGKVWSNTHQPTLHPCSSYEAIFIQAGAEFRRRDHGIDVHTRVSVSPEDDIELRRINLVNRSREVREIELTSYAEVVIASQASDTAHPAFSKLFVQTSIDRGHQAILCSRRARSAEERPAWMLHLMTLTAGEVGEASYETDRMRFLGRGRSPDLPLALVETGPLSGSAGPVLDPVASIRRTVRLQPDQEVDIDLVFGMADSREAAEALIGKYHDQQLCERIVGLSRAHGQVVLRQLGASEADAQLFGRLAGAIIHPLALRRAPASLLVRNRRGQAGLWAYGISGDLPIVLVRISDEENLGLVRDLLRAHVYWRALGLSVDLVIWNEDHSVYRQALYDQIAALVASGSEAGLVDRPGGIFVRRSEQMAEEDRILLQTVARMVISDRDASLAQFADRRPRGESAPLRLPRPRPYRGAASAPVALPANLVCGNGLGGFTRDGREYIMALEDGVSTPLPWVNVLANPEFGSVISEAGSAYTWAGNSHEYRLTPWHGDPVSDPSGEAFYLRDEESGRFWSPSPQPSRGTGRYVVRHGFGYSAFQHEEDGLACEMMVYVATDAPVKLVSIRLRNRSSRQRRLSLTGYWEWVLGEQRQQTAMHIVTELDHASGMLIARNSYHGEASTRIAFVDVSDRNRSLTGDRGEFLGRNGTVASPAALGHQRFSGRVGPGLDPCAALQVAFELAEDEQREIVFVLGAADGIEQARQLAQRFCAVEGARLALEQVWRHWNHTLGALRVETPDPALDILANGWLVYQTIACRMWARSGFYQSGGAFGFRDQLQDAMALIQVAPWLLREQLLRSAAHQFKEGDVQHWWHPPGGRGVRTRSSDDFLWLPCAAARYCQTTGDTGVLDELVPFLEGRELRNDEETYFDQPAQGAAATLYEHCVRAIHRGLRWGSHGLPLMGGGDWNDGMNLVGAAGRGESVWLAFFLYDVLQRFAPVAQGHGDADFALRCRQEAEALQTRIEAGAWDGAWYRRAYCDDGTPIGSVTSPECQIDSLPQSWAVLSGAADDARARQAMQEVDRRLVSRPDRLIRIFTPPFDRSELDPGYIKGYVPGVRENGGQYTHAAIWTAMAFAALGEPERAWELWSLLDPVGSSSSPQSREVYQAEPYVVAADVYAAPPHLGRAGWTWYTGSAGWMYRLLTESLLGLNLEPDALRIDPRLPASWSGFTVHYRFRDTHYRIQVERGVGEPAGILLDGVRQEGRRLPLVDDRRDHEVRVGI